MKLFTRTGITRTDADQLAGRLKALADPVRLQILASPSLPGQNVGDLATMCRVAQPTMSHHLRILVTAGFLTAERRGLSMFHTLRPAGIAEVAAALRGAR